MDTGSLLNQTIQNQLTIYPNTNYYPYTNYTNYYPNFYYPNWPYYCYISETPKICNDKVHVFPCSHCRKCQCGKLTLPKE